MNWYLYVLKSLKDSKLYIGVSKHPHKRLLEHNAGKSRSTKPRRPFVLIYQKEFDNEKEAYKYEWHVKNTGEGNIELKKKFAEVAKVVKAPV